MFTLGLLAVCLACSGDPTSPTSPMLDGLGSLSSEGKGGKGGGNGGGNGGGGGSGGDGGSDPPDPSVDLLAGWTVAGLPVTVKDRKQQLYLEGQDNSLAFAMTATHAKGVAPCSIDPVDTPSDVQQALLDKLVQQQPRFNLLVTYDKQSPEAPSDGHGISTNWNEAGGKLYTVRVGEKPTFTEDPSSDTFTLTGGQVIVWDRSGQVRDFVKLKCPNLDTIVLALTR